MKIFDGIEVLRGHMLQSEEVTTVILRVIYLTRMEECELD